MSNPISSLSDCTPELLAAMQVNEISLALRASFKTHDPTFIPLLLDALFLDIGTLADICRLALKDPLDDSDTAAVCEMLPLLPSWCLSAHDIVAMWVEKSPIEHIQALLDATQSPEYALGILWESCTRKRLDCATAALHRCDPVASDHEALRRCLAFDWHEGVELLLCHLQPSDYPLALKVASCNANGSSAKLILPIIQSMAHDHIEITRAFLRATRHGKVDVVRALLPFTNPRAKKSKALRVAAKYGHDEVVVTLLPHSNAQAKHNQAFRKSVERGHVKTALELLPHSNVSDLDHIAIKWAAYNADFAILKAIQGSLTTPIDVNHVEWIAMEQWCSRAFESPRRGRILPEDLPLLITTMESLGVGRVLKAWRHDTEGSITRAIDTLFPLLDKRYWGDMVDLALHAQVFPRIPMPLQQWHESQLLSGRLQEHIPQPCRQAEPRVRL